MLRRSHFIGSATRQASQQDTWRTSRSLVSTLSLAMAIFAAVISTAPLVAKETSTNLAAPVKKNAADVAVNAKVTAAVNAKVTAASEAKNGEYTIVFPKDKSYGTFYNVPTEVTLAQAHPNMRFVASARGTVHLKSNLRILFQGNALIAEKPEMLALLPTGTVALVLTELDLSGQAFAYASKLTDIEYLQLGGTEISDQSLKIIAGFHNLRFLEISSTQVNGSGFTSLKACPHLFILRATHVYLKEFNGLADLSAIDWLDLSHSAVTDAALVPIGKMKMLGNLEIPNSKVSNAGLKSLQNLKHLRTIDLRDSQVTGEGLYSLSKLHLINILISPGRIQDSDKAALLKLFPRIQTSEEKSDLKQHASELFAPLH
jgi:Leucine Rich repeat